MTQTFSINDNNDIFIGKDGNLSISVGLQAVLEICEQYAKTILGELVLQTDQGVPYFQAAFNGTPNPTQFEAGLRKIIMSVPEVTNITYLTLTAQNNIFSYSIGIQTIYGTGVING